MSSRFWWSLVDIKTYKTVKVTKPTSFLGRSKEADLVSLSVATSRRHAVFNLSEDGILTVTDLDSLNGTFLNQTKLLANQAYRLQDGDQVCAGLDVDSSLKHDTPHTIILVKRFDNLETINVDDSDEGDKINDDVNGNVNKISLNENQMGSEEKEEVEPKISDWVKNIKVVEISAQGRVIVRKEEIEVLMADRFENNSKIGKTDELNEIQPFKHDSFEEINKMETSVPQKQIEQKEPVLSEIPPFDRDTFENNSKIQTSVSQNQTTFKNKEGEFKHDDFKEGSKIKMSIQQDQIAIEQRKETQASQHDCVESGIKVQTSLQQSVTTVEQRQEMQPLKPDLIENREMQIPMDVDQTATEGKFENSRNMQIHVEKDQAVKQQENDRVEKAKTEIYVQDQKAIEQEQESNVNESESKVPAKEKDFIIIDDDDDDDGISILSQLLENKTSSGDKMHAASDDAYYNIKKELEILDGENENMSVADDIIEDYLSSSQLARELEMENEKLPEEPIGEVSKETESVPANIFYKNFPPPIVEPHIQKDKTTVKRKSDTSNKAQTLRKKQRTDAEVRKNKIKKLSEEKNKEIVETRRNRLKDLAAKSQVTEKKEVKKSSKPKVKVSEGRGGFLLNGVAETKTSNTKNTANRTMRAAKTAASICNAVDAKKASTNNKMKVTKRKVSISDVAASAKIVSMRTETTNNAENVQALSNRTRSLSINNNETSKSEKTIRTKQTVAPTNALRAFPTENMEVPAIVSKLLLPNNEHNNNVALDVDLKTEIAEILAWDADWLRQQYYGELNPVSRMKNAKPSKDRYSSYEEYCSIYSSLLMIEVWSQLQKEYMSLSNKICRMWIENYDVMSQDLWKLKCSMYINSSELQTSSYPKEEDLLVADLRLQGGDHMQIKPSFGFVSKSSRVVLREHHYINENLANKCITGKPAALINFDVLIAPFAKATKHIVNFKTIMSLVPLLRMFRCLKSLKDSLMLDLILSPKPDCLRLEREFKEELIFKNDLNSSQSQVVTAVASMCHRRNPAIYMVRGPPGTGKTTVIQSIVVQLLFSSASSTRLSSSSCILIVTPSNTAIDHLVLKLVNEVKPKLSKEMQKNLKLVRVGSKNSMHPSVMAYSLESLTKRYMKQHLLNMNAEAAARYRLLMENMAKVKEEMSATKDAQRINTLKQRLEDLSKKSENFTQDNVRGENYSRMYDFCCDKVLCRANVICTTLSSCTGKIMLSKFHRGKLKAYCCIVDEASQGSELETLIPLALGVQKLVLIGDEQQLPATVISLDAKALSYGCSFFDRLLRNNYPSTLLEVQYRMHPDICNFPNRFYYSGRLNTRFGYTKPLYHLNPFLVFMMKGCEGRVVWKDYQNVKEVEFIKQLLEAIEQNVPEETQVTIGIITPYNSQKTLLSKMLQSKTLSQHISVVCDTVDGFQGKETDVTILSCVKQSSTSFLSDSRRLNVALTRAKYALYVVGTQQLFKICGALGKLRENVEERKRIVSGSLTDEQLKQLVWSNPTQSANFGVTIAENSIPL